MAEIDGSGTVTVAPYTPGDDGATDAAHVEAMVAKVEAGTDGTPKEPVLIAGKFKSNEDLEKATLELLRTQKGEGLADYYKELESNIGKAKDDDATDTAKAGDADGANEDGTEDDANAEKDEQKGFAKFSQEFTEKGELSDESYKELAETHNLSKEMVDAYIAGQVALSEKAEGTLYNEAGGKEKYGQMTEWAAENVTPAERAAYNKAIGSGDADIAKLAISGLKAKWVAAVGQNNGERIAPNGGSANSAGVVGYQSTAQMTADMKNPLYKTDPAFRAKVGQKIANSSIM